VGYGVAVRDTALAEYYLLDPRVVLVPVEDLTDDGLTPELAALVTSRAGWTDEHVALFDAGWTLYWAQRGPRPPHAHLARAAPPSRGGRVTQPDAVRPCVQLLNTSAWLVYAADVDPATSDPELLAFVLALGDRMAATGEVTTAAVQAAAWWLERTDEECAAFADGATRSTRPDADAYVAVAEAIAWLRSLHHEVLRPAAASAPGRAIPSTGLFVPIALEAEPPRLVDCWQRSATRVVARHHAAWRRSDPALVANLCDWLAAEAPPLVVAAENGRVAWDPDAPERVGALRAVLKTADAVAVEAVHRDLERIASLTHSFMAAVVDPAALPAPDASTTERGYTYLHSDRRLIAYDLHEPGMER
jgi:hypothetical protein